MKTCLAVNDIYFNRFAKSTMSEECPNCRQLTNTSFSRLVKDSCGHTKCRMCLLYEEQGCKTCHNENRIQNIGNLDSQPQLVSENLTTDVKDPVTVEEIVLPLELVINKDSKCKANSFEFLSVDSVSDTETHHGESITFDNRKDVVQEQSSSPNNDSNPSSRLYIPKIEPCDMISNIQTHLNSNDAVARTERTYVTEAISQVDTNESVKLEYMNGNKSINDKPLKYPDRSHITVVPGNPERYKCNVCGKTFRNKKGKCYHDACITGVRPYQCNFCDRSFVKRSHFEYHERVHSGYKPYKCNLCEKAFPQQNKLNRHMFSHSKEKQFVCPKCNKGYSKRDDLKNHLNLHNGTATYSCKSCNKSFRLLTNLKRHMRTHTNERPHSCDQCSKSFKDKSLLIRHKRTHGKERPFSCAHCNRVFLSKSELRRHLTVHSDEKPFSCKYCQTFFRRKDNLNRHVRHHHTENTLYDVKKPQNTGSVSTKKTTGSKGVNGSKQKKSKKTQRTNARTSAKSPTKVSVVYVNSREQINSRLDSMGNITPVIRTTSELSNAVPVINGPINIRKPEEKTDTRKKTFTYTEPIPLAEAVVINRRIEEKLYPQNALNHNYFFRSHPNRMEKQQTIVSSQSVRINYCSKESIISRPVCPENPSFEATAMVQNNLVYQNADLPAAVVTKDVTTGESASVGETSSLEGQSTQRVFVNDCNGEEASSVTNISDTDQNVPKKASKFVQEQATYVSTIKKHILSQFESDDTKNVGSMNHVHEKMNDNCLLKNSANPNERKQSNMHWRRRTAETLKPCSQ